MFTRRSLPALLALSVLFTVVTASAVLAVDNAAVKGTWKLSFEMQGQAVDATLEIKDGEGGALTGTWTGPRGTDTLQNVTWDGTTLTFSRTVDRQGQQFAIEHTATIKGDAIEGKMVLPQREIPFTGKKSA